MIPKADIPDHNVSLTVKWFHNQSTRISFTPVQQVLSIHTTKQFRVSFSKIIKWRISGCLFTKVTKFLTKCTSGSKNTVWQFLHNVSLWVWKCKTEWSIRRSDLLDRSRATECLRAGGLDLQPTAARPLSVFSSVRSVSAYGSVICCTSSGLKLLL
jgi:hypothetical protein